MCCSVSRRGEDGYVYLYLEQLLRSIGIQLVNVVPGVVGADVGCPARQM